MITKQELVDGSRFAGRRAAAAGANAKDWNHQLAHQWTTRDAFSHLAATAGGAAGLYPLLDAGVLSGMGADRIAQGNASAIDKMKDQTKEEIPPAHGAGPEAERDREVEPGALFPQAGGSEVHRDPP